MKKIAVILFNLGGPDGPKAVKPFLLNLFSDPAIIHLPAPLRQTAARLIAGKRAKTARAIYAKIGGRSPILENTQAQAKALAQELADLGEIRCLIAMRYWHPFIEEIARETAAFEPDEIVLLPLYPQFSTTTTASSLKAWEKAARASAIKASVKIICCYPEEPGFIEAMTQAVRAAFEKATSHGAPRILFSAHGLPEKIVRQGDPYAFQCQRTAETLAKKLNLKNSDWVLCYQSRVGPLSWIGPSVDEEIARAGRDRVPVVIVPISFTCEHAETLFELDIFYRDLAVHTGVPYFVRVSTVGAAPLFIGGLARLVRQALAGMQKCPAGAGNRICPPGLTGCVNYDRG